MAIAEANRLRLPVIAGFGLMDDDPEANLRRYAFMLQGLQEVARDLADPAIDALEIIDQGSTVRPLSSIIARRRR